MTKIEAVGNKDKLQEKAAQQNWEGPTKTKGEAKQEVITSSNTPTTIKAQPQVFTLPPLSKPIDARGPIAKPGIESTIDPTLNASKPSASPAIAQKTGAMAEISAGNKPSYNTSETVQNRTVPSVDVGPQQGWSGVKNILVEDAKESLRGTKETFGNIGEKVKDFVSPTEGFETSRTTSTTTFSTSRGMDNPRALEAVDRTVSVAFSPAFGIATDELDDTPVSSSRSLTTRSSGSSSSTSSPPLDRRELMWRGAAESTGHEFRPDAPAKTDKITEETKRGFDWAKDKTYEAADKLREDAEWGIEKAREKKDEWIGKAKSDVDWAKDKTKEAGWKASEGARNLKEEVSNKAYDAAHRTKEDIDWAKDKTKEAGWRVSEGVRSTKDELAHKAKEDLDWAKDKSKENVDWAKGKAKEAGWKAKEDLDWAKDKTKENVDWAKSKAKEDLDWAKDKAKENVDWAKDKTKETGWNAAQAVKEDVDWAKEKAKGVAEATKDTVVHAAETAKAKTLDIANKTYEGAKYEADVVKDSTGRFIEKQKTALKEDAEIVKDKVAAVSGGVVSALESATDVVLKEAKDFGRAVVNTAEDVKDGLLESKEELKHAAADKTQDIKDRTAATIHQGREKVKDTFYGSGEPRTWSTTESAPAEAARQYGGSVMDKTRIFAEETVNNNAGVLHEDNVRRALEEQKKIEGERKEEGFLSSVIHWVFRGGVDQPTVESTSTTGSTLTSDEAEASRYNKKLERMNSVAYSPAMTTTYDLPVSEVSAKEMLPRTTTTVHTTDSLPILTTVTTTTATPYLDETGETKTSATSSYFQPYNTEQEKKEVEERVLEQTIDFFY